jgi:hypothetical protein
MLCQFEESEMSRGGKAPHEKGSRFERALVRYLQEAGFAAERMPLSGSAGGKFSGDISVPILGIDRCVEAKILGNGFRRIYGWLEGRDFLIVRADRQEPVVIIPLRLAAEIAKAAEKAPR